MKGVLRDVVTMAVFVRGNLWIHMQSPPNQPPLRALAVVQSAGHGPLSQRAVLVPRCRWGPSLIVFAAMDYAYVNLMVPEELARGRRNNASIQRSHRFRRT